MMAYVKFDACTDAGMMKVLYHAILRFLLAKLSRVLYPYKPNNLGDVNLWLIESYPQLLRYKLHRLVGNMDLLVSG